MLNFRYLQKPGSGVSMKEVTAWAKRPVARMPIFVIGSAYHPYRGYSEGAIMSANNALKEGWQLPTPNFLHPQRNPPRKFSEMNWRGIR